ncbi:aspartate aminotransferase family protein [Evansella sp. AB-P1]|uniref:aspartate aminotransferase family protein n=1 Tax=Evansella sp. AB-P1 TaxID=3037653 RepID=UPI00241CFF79|nr:aspartate aminotransferase family protein [Evansella sp. AB-P1]MDG5787518.1 aspartate aminotransferase family protein [Evansella sp. AB-P1]
MDDSYLIKPNLDGIYSAVAYGKGIFLYDKDGKEYIDGSSGAISASIGHGVLEIAEVMKEQAKMVSFVYRSQFTSEPAEKLALKLKKWAPSNVNWSFFVNSGSEATETALKVALQYWKEKGMPTKTIILSRWMSYHGITIGALSMSGHVSRRRPFIPLLENFPTIEAPYCYRCPLQLSYPSCQLMCAKELDRYIQRIGAEYIAAFIAEPIIGAAGGAIVPPKGYYEEIRKICDNHDILFITDEVMTGIGRCGKKFAIEYWNVAPDIMALGKGLSGGYTPLAATMISDKVLEPILNGSKQIMSGHTYSANPQSTAIAFAVLDYMEVNNLVKKAEEMGYYLLKKLKVLQSNYPIMGDVRGIGLLIGVEFVCNNINKASFPSSIQVTNRVVQKSQNNGLIVYPALSGADAITGDAVLIAPPLIIRKNEIDQLVHIFEKVVKELQEELQKAGYFHFFQ